MSVFGRVTYHLHAAREMILRYDSTTTAQRVAVDAVLVQLDLLIVAVRAIHHRIHLGLDGDHP